MKKNVIYYLIIITLIINVSCITKLDYSYSSNSASTNRFLSYNLNSDELFGEDDSEDIINYFIDNDKPIIEFKKTLKTTVGKKINLLKNVKVSDNSGEKISAKVVGDFNFNVAGTYNLKYVATDSSNNVTEEDFKLVVNEQVTTTQPVVVEQPTYTPSVNAGSTRANIVEIARSQLGNVGGKPYWSWYGFSGRVEWCACFVSWVANQAGVLYTDIPKFAGVGQGARFFKSKGQWQGRSYTPSPGDIIFFDYNYDGRNDHVGIVERVENGTVYTIEGNSTNTCKNRSYPVGGKMIYGYGVPAY